MRLAAVAAVAAAVAAAAPPRSPSRSPQTMEYLLSLTTSTPGGRPAGVSLEFDCSWRELAAPYALKLQPSMTEAQQKQLHDALQLSTLCSKPFVPVASAPAPSLEEVLPAVAGRPALFVDATQGSDSNGGTLAKPFRTIARALNASRQTAHGIADAPIIQLRAGTFYLPDTLVLTAADSGLTIAAYQGEEAVLSGGVRLGDLKWTKSATNHKIWVSPVKEDLSGSGGSSGFVAAPGALPAGHDIRKANMTIPAAEAWCQSNSTCAGFTVRVSGTLGTAGVKEIYFKSTAGATISDAAWMTYLKPPAGSGPPPPAMAALQFPAASGKMGGVFARATLARHPNANPELDLFPEGYITAKNAQSWLPPKFNSEVCNPRYQCGKSVNLTLPAPKDEWHGMYQDYTVGIGGSCSALDPPWSPWCSGQFYLERQFPEMHTRHPSGLTTAALPNAPYAKPEGAVVHAWRPGHWYSWMFEVESYNASHSFSSSGGGSGGSYIFATDKGGNQGGEGSESAGEWWIEGMREDLDAENEYWFDETAQELHFYYNGTGPPPSEAVVPKLANLIELQGAQAYPVRNVSLVGLTFTANRPTFMEPRGNPSGGDWSLERMGAVMLEGVEHTLVAGCTFTKLDSNALFLSGYSRHAVITNNSFSWLGQNAIASWGKSNFNDGTNGDQPRGTVVSGNWATEVGVIQKQSSMYFQAETAQATIVDNVCFNIPRAAVNFNDGFGGGAEMARNLLFNTCRESSDHGAFNSWDRLPYITEIRDGKTPSTIPAWNNMHHNFIVANYAADGGCLDNDDGSSYYDIHHNYCVFGGHKSDFDGNSKVSSFNLHVYPSVYGSKCFGELQYMPPKGYAEGYHDNTCILPAAAPGKLPLYGSFGGFGPGGHTVCDGSAKSVATLPENFVLGNNTVYAVGGNATVTCNSKPLVLDEFNSLYDKTTKIVAEAPSPAQITGWAKSLLCPAGWEGSCW